MEDSPPPKKKKRIVKLSELIIRFNTNFINIDERKANKIVCKVPPNSNKRKNHLKFSLKKRSHRSETNIKLIIYYVKED